jgi:hypothetical protein
MRNGLQRSLCALKTDSRVDNPRIEPKRENVQACEFVTLRCYVEAEYSSVDAPLRATDTESA